MTRQAVAATALAAASTALSAVTVLVRPPLAHLATLGALPWVLALTAFALWPLVLAVTYRSRTAWSVAVSLWAWAVVAVAARLHRWMTLPLWVLLAAVVLVATISVALRWQAGETVVRRTVS